MGDRAVTQFRERHRGRLEKTAEGEVGRRKGERYGCENETETGEKETDKGVGEVGDR